MKKESWALGLSIVAITLSITATCMAAYRTPELEFDYQGVIVGVLSLLVTALIGWNIYNIIDFNKKAEELSTKTNVMSSIMNTQLKEQDRMGAVMENTMSDIYYSLLGLKDPLTLEYKYMYHKIWSLVYSSKMGDITTCNIVVKTALSVATHPEEVLLTNECKQTLIVLLSKVENAEKIERFDEIVERVAKFGVKR